VVVANSRNYSTELLLVIHVKRDTIVVLLHSLKTGEFNTFGLSIAIARDIDVEAVGIELRSTSTEWLHIPFFIPHVAMKCQKLRPEGIDTGLDITGKLESIASAGLNKLNICPEF
jgi:hypothetical protein